MKDWIIKFVVLVLLLSFASLPLAAEVIYYDTNNVGTPVAMWDSTGGKVWEATYYPFGTEYQTPTNIWENTRKFAGKEKDKETDLSYFGARYYDDLSGRFLTPDPVQPVDALTSKTNAEMLNNPQRLNRYAYGLNNPYRYVDPDGRNPGPIHPGNGPFSQVDIRSGIGIVDHTVLGMVNTAVNTTNYFANSIWPGVEAVGSDNAFAISQSTPFPYDDAVVSAAAIMSRASGPFFKTTSAATAAAKKLGFQKINETVHDGQAVYKRGKTFITRDLDGHNGGAWKMANSTKNLESKNTRTGTYNHDLSKRVGD